MRSRNLKPGFFKFQSTPPRGGRPEMPRVRMGGVSFNPRPRAGGDGIDDEGRDVIGVSIHAPARGATGEVARHRDHERVSIHAPARGATRAGRTRSTRSTGFNPRPRAGGDKVASVKKSLTR